MTITQEEVKELFVYKDGKLYRKVRKANCVHVGDCAGSISNNNYFSIQIDKTLYLTHGVVFLYHHGYLPTFIDHVNCNKLDNRVENLRPSTSSENARNIPKRSIITSSKFKGVSWNKRKQQWVVSIMTHGIRKFIGYYIIEEDAARAYDQFAKEHHGEYARLNIG